jgi:hydrogenase maturation protease
MDLGACFSRVGRAFGRSQENAPELEEEGGAPPRRISAPQYVMKTLVIGLGNPILTDDGVGIYAARVVRNALPPDSGIDVIELAVGGLALMEAMIDYERVIVLDAVWSPEEETGAVLEFGVGNLPGTLNTASAHDVNLPTALRAGRSLGASLPADEDIHIVGVTANEVLTFGERPNPRVAAAIPEAVGRVLALLGYDPPDTPDPYHGVEFGGIDDLS